MPVNPDLKRLVRSRMAETGERYTTARAAIVGDDVPPVEPPVPASVLRLVDGLDDTTFDPDRRVARLNLALAQLEALSPDDVRAAALLALSDERWRVRRGGARLLDDIALTPATIAALERAMDDPHPKVRRAAIHTLGCAHCKPDGCVVLSPQQVTERALADPNREVRRGAVHALGWKHNEQWAIDLLARVATEDPSEEVRTIAAGALRSWRQRWESDEARRQLPPDLVAKTERHPGRWVAIADGRIVAIDGPRALTRAVRAGADRYWVAPPDLERVTVPSL